MANNDPILTEPQRVVLIAVLGVICIAIFWLTCYFANEPPDQPIKIPHMAPELRDERANIMPSGKFSSGKLSIHEDKTLEQILKMSALKPKRLTITFNREMIRYYYADPDILGYYLVEIKPNLTWSYRKLNVGDVRHIGKNIVFYPNDSKTHYIIALIFCAFFLWVILKLVFSKRESEPEEKPKTRRRTGKYVGRGIPRSS